ncbi:MAG: ABC transporter ATP-binding protein [Candidatus Limivivens sp.]|nr:ABC transporter ATP-binding protein [Candidatus Limivivens sp.]
MSEIVLKNVCKIYDNHVYAVKDFSLEIEDKEFVIFVGPSGCGKSTTLRMIAGLEEISEGELWIDGNLCNYVEPKDRNLSMVFQNYALYPNMNVYDNLAFSLQIRKVPKKKIDQKVHEVARLLGIESLLKRRPKELSGGQKQRVAIGSALVRQTKVLLMDEPLSNLDAKLRAQMRIELARIHHEMDGTIIYVTHDQTEAMTLGTKIVVLNAGIIQQVAAPGVLYSNPANLFVAGFIGSPAMNFFDVKITEENGNTYAVPAGFKDRYRLLVESVRGEYLRKEYLNRTVVMGIRPEDFHEEESAEKIGLRREDSSIEGVVTAREMLGHEVQLYFSYPGKDYSARLCAGVTAGTGERVKLYPDMVKVHFFDKDTENNLFYSEALA